MDDELYLRLLRRLVFEPHKLSRNRNFHTFASADTRRARRVAAHLRSLRNDLRGAGPGCVALELDDGAWRLRIHDPAAGLVRDAWLDATELDILREDPDVAATLDGAVSG